MVFSGKVPFQLSVQKKLKCIFRVCIDLADFGTESNVGKSVRSLEVIHECAPGCSQLLLYATADGLEQ